MKPPGKVQWLMGFVLISFCQHVFGAIWLEKFPGVGPDQTPSQSVFNILIKAYFNLAKMVEQGFSGEFQD